MLTPLPSFSTDHDPRRRLVGHDCSAIRQTAAVARGRGSGSGASAIRPSERSDSRQPCSAHAQSVCSLCVSALRSLSPACAPACAGLVRPLRCPSRRRRRSRRISVARRTDDARGGGPTHSGGSVCYASPSPVRANASLVCGCCFARLTALHGCTTDGRRSSCGFVSHSFGQPVRRSSREPCCCIERQQEQWGDDNKVAILI